MGEENVQQARERLADEEVRRQVLNGDVSALADLALTEEDVAMLVTNLDEFADDEVEGLAQLLADVIPGVFKVPGPPAPFVPTPLPNIRHRPRS